MVSYRCSVQDQYRSAHWQLTGPVLVNGTGTVRGHYRASTSPLEKKRSAFVVALYWLPLDGQYDACTGPLGNHKGFVLAK